jgi:hypothetical protein
MNSDSGNRGKDAMQVLAIICLAFMFSLILHKGFADVSLISELHSGREFWIALARHFIGTLSGG